MKNPERIEKNLHTEMESYIENIIRKKGKKQEESKIERSILPIGGKIYIIGSNMKIYESEKNHFDISTAP